MALTIADADVFNLETNPGASKTIYLDFNGADLKGTAWIPTGSTWDGLAPAFSLDSDTSTNFSVAELAAIKQIFARVACDYAPFNVNVTTRAPAADLINRASTGDSVFGTVCLFSNISAQTGYSGSGGVAYIGVFNSVNAEVYKPALVFPDKLSNSAKNIAEAASHEIGHNLGLRHDGTTASSYYQGQGTSPGWAPIMGSGYTKALTQFSRGAYSGANNSENDFSLIAGEEVGFWQDAVGNDRATAQGLAFTDANGDGISDPLRLGGTIELTASDGLATPDQDVYGFQAPSNGSVTIRVTNALYFFDPALARSSFAAVPAGYGNLRLDARLQDDTGLVLADWSTNASLDIANFSVSGLIGGRNYYLSVLANTASPDGEDTWGSLGDYILDLVYQGQPIGPAAPVLSVALSPQSVDENAGVALVYTFTRTGSIDTALDFSFNVSGTASAESDYMGVAAGAGTLTFAAGSATASLQVTPIADSTVEPDETVIVSLVSGTGYALGGSGTVTGTIRNDDQPPTYSLAAPTSVPEGQALSIGITTTRVADGTLLTWRLSGTGVSDVDFAPAALSGSVTVNGNAASLPLVVAADNSLESTESALFELLDGSVVVASQTIALLDTNVRWGTAGDDSIIGTGNRFERITGVPQSGSTATVLGGNQRDVVTGGSGPDEFLLSEIRSGALQVFYNDAVNKTTGEANHLRITDFNISEDKLRFAGGRYFSLNSGSDTQIWWDRNGNGSLNPSNNQPTSDELIAVLAGVNLGTSTINSGSTANPAWVVYG
ncbi:MAG: Calx-beta domain-containing protein [Cyanobium sp.]